MAATKDDKNKDAKKDGAAEGAAPAGKKKLGLVAGGLVLLALGAGTALLAVPRPAPQKPRLQGPFVSRLSKEDLQVNLAGENGKRYLVLALSGEYFVYDPKYAVARFGEEGGEGSEDALFAARLKDAMLNLAARRTREQVEDPVQMDAFLMEVRAAVEPLLFPVCVGDSIIPQDPDSASGLRLGESSMESSLRGLLHDHALHLDATKRTIRLDDGPEIPFQGTERDLRVLGANGETVFLDVTSLEEDFVGDVPVGAPGRLRRIYREQVLVQ